MEAEVALAVVAKRVCCGDMTLELKADYKGHCSVKFWMKTLCNKANCKSFGSEMGMDLRIGRTDERSEWLEQNERGHLGVAERGQEGPDRGEIGFYPKGMWSM